MNANEAKSKADLFHLEQKMKLPEVNKIALDFILKSISLLSAQGKYEFNLNDFTLIDAKVLSAKDSLPYQETYDYLVSELRDALGYQVVTAERANNYIIRWR